MQAIVPLIVGTVLFFSALLKAWDGSGPHGVSVELADALVVVELALAAACIARFQPHKLRALLLTLFTCFAVHAIFLLAIDAESCGCFGAAKVPPSWTLLLDIAILMVLWRWQPPEESSGLPSNVAHERMKLIMAFAVIILPTAIVFYIRQPTALTSGNSLEEVDGIVILEPETWVGTLLPIASEVDIGDELATGEWLVLLYHHDCSRCQEAAPVYRQRAKQLAREGNACRVALIEMPPHALQSLIPENVSDSPCLEGRLSNRREWFVQTPVEIFLKEGNVVDVRSEL